MYWNSFADFLAMGKHGVYVWGSFSVMVLVMIVEPLLVVRRRKQLIERLRRQYRAERLEQTAGNGGRIP
jgi:heme exporter protein D